MKKLIPLVLGTLALSTTTALAHPGGHSLSCKSASSSGSKQKVEFNLTRSNGIGWYGPSYALTLNGKKFDFGTEDEMQSYGETFHNSPLGVITVTANNQNDEAAAVHSSFSVVAVPASVKAFNTEGKRVKWSFSAEKDECNDSAGKAEFKAIFRGWMDVKESGKDTNVEVDTQILNCTLEYNSGMAC